MPEPVKGGAASRTYNSPLRAEQAERTRRRILVAARELFLARGYNGTTVAAVADAASVAEDTVYTSLGGKKGLLEGVWAAAVSDPEEADQRERQRIVEQIDAADDPHRRLRLLVTLSCGTLARTSPVHAVLRNAADGHPFAAELRARMLDSRLRTQSDNLRAFLEPYLGRELTAREAAERYSALLSPELFHLLTVERGWSTGRFRDWIIKILDHDLLESP